MTFSDITVQMAKFLKPVSNWLKDNFRMDHREAGRIALHGLITQNPTFVLLLGLCPALAATTSLQYGIGMGLSTTIVLICSTFVISLLRKFLVGPIRTVACMVIIAAFSSAVDLLMQAFTPELSQGLSLYITLIAVNGMVLGRAESFACRNIPGKALLDGLSTGLGFTGALAVLGSIREILGAGTIWGYPVPVLNSCPVGLALSPAGGFILLGVLLALVQFIRRLGKGGRTA